MGEVDCIPHARQAKHAFHIGGKPRIIGDAPAVRLEQPMIGGIEADQRDEQPDVGFGEDVTEQELSGEPCFEPVEHAEDPASASS